MGINQLTVCVKEQRGRQSRGAHLLCQFLAGIKQHIGENQLSVREVLLNRGRVFALIRKK